MILSLRFSENCNTMFLFAKLVNFPVGKMCRFSPAFYQKTIFCPAVMFFASLLLKNSLISAVFRFGTGFAMSLAEA